MTEEQNTDNSETKPKSSRKRRIVVVLAVLIIAMAGYLIWLFNRPAVGIIRTVERQETEIDRRAALPLGVFDGTYASFSYPGEYTPRNSDPDTVSVEKAVFIASGMSSRTLAVAIIDMRGKTLDDIPAYRLRNDVKKAQYAREKGEIADGSEGIVFTKQEEGYEKTAFVLGNGFLATVSVSSQAFADPEQIESDFDSILGSFAFKK